MERLDNIPDDISSDNSPDRTESGGPQTAEAILKTMTQDLQELQQDLVTHLNQDIRRLQAEKSRLINDIEKLQNQQQTLQSQYEGALSRQQIAQQQAWAKQLALVLANHLQAALNDRLNQMMTIPNQSGMNVPQLAAGNSDNTQRVLASLDDTVNRTFDSLRHDLNSYQSSLAQQLDRMQNLGRQGEAILEVLVGRLSQQLQIEATKAQVRDRSYGTNLPEAGSNYALTGINPPSVPLSSYPPVPVPPPPSAQPEPTAPSLGAAFLPTTPNVAPEPTVAPVKPSRPKRLSHFQIGLVMVLLSTLSLSLHHVVVGILGNASKLFGVLPVGGYINLNTISSSVLVLWMRTLVVVPLMAWLSGFLYKSSWRDVKSFASSNDRRLLGSVIGSGFFLFLSQIFIYISIGLIGPGIAVTLLFIYPIATVPLMWALFNDRPTRFRAGVMLVILLGVVLTAYLKLDTAADAVSREGITKGIVMAVLSGVAFAIYLVTMQISFRKLHPVPVSLIQFASMFVFSSLGLILLGIKATPNNWIGFMVGGAILGILTLAGYFLNNLGVRYMGAARASILAASSPALTALLAFLVIPGSLTKLYAIQIVGILIVTLGVTALAVERMLIQNKAIKAAK
jgi:drug/metabolite transporter (DMT)-like permease